MIHDDDSQDDRDSQEEKCILQYTVAHPCLITEKYFPNSVFVRVVRY